MLKTQISLIGVVFLAVFIQTVLIPGIWSPLRVDLFLGMIVGVIIHVGFSHGLLFVLVSSFLLQAFTGARAGLVPLFYVFTFLAVDVIKDIIYLENVMTQLVLGALFSALSAWALVVFLDTSPTLSEIIPMVTGCLLTGCVSPLMVSLVGRVKRAYET